MKQLLSILLAALATHVRAAEPIQFSRDVLPILSANCFACHGPDEHERQADLRLDIEDEAKKLHDDVAAVVAGSVDKSSIIARILSTDPDLVMPPPKANRTVSKEQIEILQQWIAEGATWQRHWSFEPVVKPTGTIDEQVKSELSKKGLSLQPPASPQTLLRRLSLDVIGLPPTPEAADAFASDPSEAAYERIVDELLQRPQFGEHWARMWLDLARYADTKGYEKDLGRTMWPYRDWVVKALNADMPLDQFTIEQLAGDLLPNPTEQQLIATAFHRNTMANDEGGTDDEEFRSVAVKDRIDTTIQVWMGLTMGCAKCHSHKYDPISNSAYYQFYALFNQTEDADRYDDAPRMQITDEAQRNEKATLVAAVNEIDAKVKEAESAFVGDDASGWKALAAAEAKTESDAKLTSNPDGSVIASGKAGPTDTYTVVVKLPPGTYTALRIEAMLAKLGDGSLGVGRNPRDPNFVISEFKVDQVLADTNTPVQLSDPKANYSQEGWPVAAAIDGDTKTGWAISPRQRERHAAMFELQGGLKLESDGELRITITQNYGDRLVLAKFRLSASQADPATLIPLPESPEIRKLRDELAAAEKRLTDFEASLAMLPIMRELAPEKQRPTKIHKRGNFLDLGETVTPDVITEFGTLPADAPRNRLGAAQWLVNKDNPLTPRVWANRVWARMFGLGIVETEEDFGALGAAPSNPALLDWLAAEYRDTGWSLKHLIKTIVLSETYRQSSEIQPQTSELDPRNSLASRGARYRLSGEVIRDQTLAAAGLLSVKRGGPAVMPPQPQGLWRSTYNGQNWIDAEGEDRYRRGLYTYLKRTTPYPSLTTFDAGSGEVCQVRRIRTNTPLQALVTMNDPVFMEAAAAFAKRITADAVTPQQRAERGLRLALIRPLRDGEIEPLLKFQADAQVAFESAPDQAAALVKSSRGDAGSMNQAEFAAWIVTASAILNLDEFLSRN